MELRERSDAGKSPLLRYGLPVHRHDGQPGGAGANLSTMLDHYSFLVHRIGHTYDLPYCLSQELHVNGFSLVCERK